MPKITKHGGVSDELDVTRGPDDVPLPLAVEGEADERVDGDEYNPGDYTVTEVNAYLDECVADGNLEEARRVLSVERVDAGGKGRAGILNRVI